MIKRFAILPSYHKDLEYFNLVDNVEKVVYQLESPNKDQLESLEELLNVQNSLLRGLTE